MSSQVVIDPEFKALIPPLSADERQQLRANIERDGVILEDIIAWRVPKGLKPVLDGHNRMEIAAELGLGYNVREIDLPNRDAAIEWIILHQFGRRNLSAMVRGELALRLKPIVAAKAKERQKTGKSEDMDLPANLPEGARPKETNETVAAAAGLSRKTIEKVEKVAEKGTPALQQAARQNKISIDAAAKAADLPADQQNEIAKAPKKSAAAKAVKEATSNATPPHEEPADPREAYNASLLAEAEVIEGAARRLTKIAGFDKGHNPTNEFARTHLHHGGTVGALRQVKRTLEESQIVETRGERHITKREAAHTANVAEQRKGVA